MVECTALEMRHTGNRIGGSNPSLSARNILLGNSLLLGLALQVTCGVGLVRTSDVERHDRGTAASMVLG